MTPASATGTLTKANVLDTLLAGVGRGDAGNRPDGTKQTRTKGNNCDDRSRAHARARRPMLSFAKVGRAGAGCFCHGATP